MITFHVTTDVKAVKGWLLATAVLDGLHLYSFYLGMGGWEGFSDVGAWSGGELMNVGGGAFMVVTKFLTLLGVFGKIPGGEEMARKRN